MEKPVLVVSAMEDVETDYLKTILKDLRKIEYKSFIFYEGTIDQKDVVLCVSNIGLINASVATTIAIEKYNPRFIINQGVAGAYPENIRTGDIVIGTGAINITSMEYKGNDNNINSYEITTFLHNEENRVIIKEADKEIIEKIKKNIDEKVSYGIIASGDIWNKNEERIRFINKKYNAICEDMESVAIYSVANLYEIPCVAIKVMSNNEVLKEKYNASVSLKSQKFVEKIIKIM